MVGGGGCSRHTFNHAESKKDSGKSLYHTFELAQ